jgi:hypothetical protein
MYIVRVVIITMNSVIGWLFSTEKDKLVQLTKLSDNKILCITDEINSLLSGEELSLSQLVVTGTQSSGKSTILARIIGMDILPTGDDMVTRMPLNVQMIKLEEKKQSLIELWDTNNASSIRLCSINITVPNPTVEEVNSVKLCIEKQTNVIAGEEKGISAKVLTMKIFSPHIPNLSFTDLPGLVMMPKTDRGQRSDIKDRLERIAIKYISKPKTIVLAIIQSRVDLETDIGLALIKKHSNKDTKVIGVLTKPDLMNDGTHIGKYLMNDISETFKLNYGYYTVRCRSTGERKDMNITECFDMENKYFASHDEYKKKVYSDRIGIGNLINMVTNVLITSVQKDLPKVFERLIELEGEIDRNLEKIGDKLPDDKDGKLAVLNKYISDFSQQVTNSIKNSESNFKIGVRMRNIFISFRITLENIRPFQKNQDVYNKQYFDTLVSSFEGNHMACSVSPVKVLEHCMQDKEHNPLQQLYDPSITCVDEICELLISMVDNILNDTQYAKYSKMVSVLKRLFQDKMVQLLNQNVKKKINELIQYERSYIWTEDDSFREMLDKFLHTHNYIELMESYYKTPKHMVQHMVPKIIMNDVVNVIVTELNSYLYDQIVNKNRIELLEEDGMLSDERMKYTGMKKRINSIKKQLNTL